MTYQSPETKLRNMLIEILKKVELHDSFTLLSLSQETMDWWIRRKKVEQRVADKRERRKKVKRLKKTIGDKLQDFMDQLDPEEKILMEKNLTYQIKVLTEYK